MDEAARLETISPSGNPTFCLLILIDQHGKRPRKAMKDVRDIEISLRFSSSKKFKKWKLKTYVSHLILLNTNANLFISGFKEENESLQQKIFKYKQLSDDMLNIQDKLIDDPQRFAQQIIEAAESVAETESNVLYNGDFVSPLEDIGLYLSILRRRRKLTVEELAQRANVSANLILQFEMGIASLEQLTENLDAVADALQIHPSLISRLLFDRILDEAQEGDES